MDMTQNVGNLDRVARAIFGAGLIVWAITGGPVWGWVGLVPLGSAVLGFCPAYTLLGIKTCPAPRA
jgi:hypothetical protein